MFLPVPVARIYHIPLFPPNMSKGMGPLWYEVRRGKKYRVGQMREQTRKEASIWQPMAEYRCDVTSPRAQSHKSDVTSAQAQSHKSQEKPASTQLSSRLLLRDHTGVQSHSWQWEPGFKPFGAPLPFCSGPCPWLTALRHKAVAQMLIPVCTRFRTMRVPWLLIPIYQALCYKFFRASFPPKVTVVAPPCGQD